MKLNEQAPEKPEPPGDGRLAVFKVFATIQGEGPFAGQPATFIRLAGCNLQCPQCDTDYTSGRTTMWPSWLLQEVEKITAPNKLVVITGGEPFRQDLAMLVELLSQYGYRVQIETNGTLAPSKGWNPNWATIICSPKAGSVNKELLPLVDGYKYVLSYYECADDGLPIRVLEHPVGSRGVARPHSGFTGPIYVQPADEQNVDKNKKNQQAAIDSCLKHGYTLCLQIHKTIGME